MYKLLTELKYTIKVADSERAWKFPFSSVALIQMSDFLEQMKPKTVNSKVFFPLPLISLCFDLGQRGEVKNVKRLYSVVVYKEAKTLSPFQAHLTASHLPLRSAELDREGLACQRQEHY